jgi:hypothetical protein
LAEKEIVWKRSRVPLDTQRSVVLFVDPFSMLALCVFARVSPSVQASALLESVFLAARTLASSSGCFRRLSLALAALPNLNDLYRSFLVVGVDLDREPVAGMKVRLPDGVVILVLEARFVEDPERRTVFASVSSSNFLSLIRRNLPETEISFASD